jgi:hypothetical protein
MLAIKMVGEWKTMSCFSANKDYILDGDIEEDLQKAT